MLHFSQCVLHQVQKHSNCLRLYTDQQNQDPYLMDWYASPKFVFYVHSFSSYLSILSFLWLSVVESLSISYLILLVSKNPSHSIAIYEMIPCFPFPSIKVVANDLDVQRCNLLIHQTKRMCTANLIVTNHEAQHFPGCRSNKKCSSGAEIGTELEPPISQLVFDRVLCDVPCSGDGTLRKAPDIWRKW